MEGPNAMTEKPARETSRQRVMRLRSDARKLTNLRALNGEEAENALDEMIRRSIDLHGA
jgi:hypothetical protein